MVMTDERGTMIATTRSGNTYQLVGPPVADEEAADMMFTIWRATFGLAPKEIALGTLDDRSGVYL